MFVNEQQQSALRAFSKLLLHFRNAEHQGNTALVRGNKITGGCDIQIQYTVNSTKVGDP
ncbi:hypothetical protein D3C75_1372890 [compost metagenome]